MTESLKRNSLVFGLIVLTISRLVVVRQHLPILALVMLFIGTGYLIYNFLYVFKDAVRRRYISTFFRGAVALVAFYASLYYIINMIFYLYYIFH